MATKSILKTINIRDKRTCSNFVKAMERAKKASCHEKQFNVQYKELKGSEIKDFFQLSSDYFCISLLDLIHNLEESCVNNILSSFSCPKNQDVEYFLKNKAIVFSQQGMSVTHLVFCKNDGIPVLVGYFCLAPKQIIARKDSLSGTMRKRIRKFSIINSDTGDCLTSALLIGQLGKNYTNGYNQLISGKDLLTMAFDKIKAVQQQVGGRLTYIECEDDKRLINFYKDNGFVYFGKRELEGDETDDFKGKYLIQMLKYISTK